MDPGPEPPVRVNRYLWACEHDARWVTYADKTPRGSAEWVKWHTGDPACSCKPAGTIVPERDPEAARREAQ